MKKILFGITLILILSVFSSCQKNDNSLQQPTQNEEAVLKAEADKAVAARTARANDFQKDYGNELGDGSAGRWGRQNIVQVAQRLPIFKSLVAAVVKTGLAPVLSSANLNATVFAPTDGAFAKPGAPFNNPANISAITDPAQIAALKNILLYHVLGTEVKFQQVANGRSSAATLKPVVLPSDNKIYFSKTLGLLFVNGNSFVLLANVETSNGVIHAIDDVLLPPTQNIAEIAIGNPAFSSLVAALVKTNLAGVFAGTGDFTVFAPTNAAFAQLPAPFNNAANIAAINNPAQIAALANILKYHVTGSRYFAWDLGFFSPIQTIADAPNNRLIGIPGANGGYVKGNQNPAFSTISPANILAVNGVVQVVNKVLLP